MPDEESQESAKEALKATLEKPASEGGAKKSKLVAKRDHILNTGWYYQEIKAGDDLSEVPKSLRSSLKTEGVL